MVFPASPKNYRLRWAARHLVGRSSWAPNNRQFKINMVRTEFLVLSPLSSTHPRPFRLSKWCCYPPITQARNFIAIYDSCLFHTPCIYSIVQFCRFSVQNTHKSQIWLLLIISTVKMLAWPPLSLTSLSAMSPSWFFWFYSACLESIPHRSFYSINQIMLFPCLKPFRDFPLHLE